MARSLTNAAIVRMAVNCAGGPQTLSIDAIGTDSAGNTWPISYTAQLAAGQITSINTFLNGLIATIEAQTSLTVTIN